MMNKSTLRLCDACGEGYLHPATSMRNVEYKNGNGKVAVRFSVCDVCKVELLDASDVLENKREWVRFRKTVDQIPLGFEIAEMRKKHHLTQSMAAKIFGGGPVAFSKYEHDDLVPDESMVNLLKLAIKFPVTVQNLAAVKGITLLTDDKYQVRITGRLISVEWSMPAAPFVAKEMHAPRNQRVAIVKKAKRTKSPSASISSTASLNEPIIYGGAPWLMQ